MQENTFEKNLKNENISTFAPDLSCSNVAALKIRYYGKYNIFIPRGVHPHHPRDGRTGTAPSLQEKGYVQKDDAGQWRVFITPSV